MAETIGSVLIEVKANLSSFEKAMADVKSQVKTVDGSTAEAIVSVDASQGMAGVAAMEKDLAGIADESVMVTADTAGLDGVKGKIGSLPDSHDVAVSVDTSEIDKAESKIDGLTAAVGAIGAGAGAAGAIGAFTSMEDSVAKVSAATQGLTNVNADLGAVVANVWQGAFGESVAEVGDAVGLVAAGLGSFTDGSTAQIQALTEKAFTLSDVFGVDMSESIGAVQALMVNGLASSATEAFDLIATGAGQLSGPMRDELISAINEYALNFDALGFTGAQAMGVLTSAVGQGNIGVDKAGDAIKEFQVRAMGGFGEAAESAEALGIDLGAMAEQVLRGGPAAQDAFGKMADAVLGVRDPVDQSKAAVAIFGTQIEDLGGIEGLTNLRDSMTTDLGEIEGSLDAAGATAYDTFGTQITEAVRAFTGALGELGGMAAPILGPMVGFFSALPGPVQAVAVGGLLLVTALIGLVALVGVLAPGLAALGIGAGATAVGTTAAGVAAAGSSVGFFAAAAGIWAMMAPLLPIIAAIAAVIAIGVLLWQNWDTIKEVAGAVWDWVADKFDWVKEKIGEAIGWLVDRFNEFKAALQLIRDKVGEVFDWVKEKIAGAILFLIEKFVGFKDAIGGAWDWIKNKASGVIDFFTSIPGKIGSVFSSIADAISSPFKIAFGFIKSLWNNTIGRLSFSIPSWVPGIGGKGFSMPQLAEGGTVTGSGFAMVGERGPERLWLGAGAIVEPLSRGGSAPGGMAYSPTYKVTVNGDLDVRQERRLADLLDSHDRDLVEMIRTGVR